MSFFKELMRRNVIKVAIAYLVIAWLVAQVLALVFESFGTPDWVMKTLLVLLATGLPFAAFFAWAFELTPEGIKRDAGRGEPTPAGLVSRHGLNFIIIGVLIAAVVFVLLDKFVLDKGRGDPAMIGGDGGIVSIAVLPLASLNSGDDKEFLADGMTASLISELSKIEALRVISRTSVQKYRDSTMSLPDIARELHAAAVIEGTVLSINDKVRVSASLIPAEQDTAVWTQTYDRDLGDVLALHSEISRAIADQVRVTLTAADASRLTPATPVDANVLEAIMRGQYIFAQTNGSKGLDLLESATVMAPHYAKGWAALATAYESMATGNPVFLEKAKIAVARAMELDDGLSDAHYVAGSIAFYYDWDWQVALREINKALDLNPGNEWALQALGDYYEVLGNWPRAIELGLRSKQSNPVSANMRMNLGLTYNYAGDYNKALAECQSALELSPGSAWSYMCVADSKAGLGLLDEAIAAAEESIRLAPQDDLILALNSFVFAATGQTDKVAEIQRWLVQESQTRYISPFSLAMATFNTGDDEAAITFLERAVEEKATYTQWINSYPGYARLRSNPRFKALIESLNLPDGNVAYQPSE